MTTLTLGTTLVRGVHTILAMMVLRIKIALGPVRLTIVRLGLGERPRCIELISLRRRAANLLLKFGALRERTTILILGALRK